MVEEDLEDVTVVIPVRNGERFIGECLESVVEAGKDRIEIIVVDDHSSDRTREIVKRFSSKGVRLVENLGKGASSARNTAIGIVKTRFVAFTDADCIVKNDWLLHLLEGMERCGADAVGGRQEPHPSSKFFERAVHDVLSLSGFAGGYMRWGKEERVVGHNPSCNSLYRVDVLRRSGGFEDGLWPGEDVEIDHRLRMSGYKVCYIPSAIVYHARPDTFPRFLTMLYRYGRYSAGYLFRRYGFFRKIYLIPPLFIALLISFVSLLLINPTFLFVSLLFLLLLLYSLLLFRSKRAISSLLSAILGASGFIVWNLGFFDGLLRGKGKG